MKKLSILIVYVFIILNQTIAYAQTTANKQLDPKQTKEKEMNRGKVR